MQWLNSADFSVAVSPRKKMNPNSIVVKLRTILQEKLQTHYQSKRVHTNRNKYAAICLKIMKNPIIQERGRN